jgi:hypothetical protein
MRSSKVILSAMVIGWIGAMSVPAAAQNAPSGAGLVGGADHTYGDGGVTPGQASDLADILGGGSDSAVGDLSPIGGNGNPLLGGSPSNGNGPANGNGPGTAGNSGGNSGDNSGGSGVPRLPRDANGNPVVDLPLGENGPGTAGNSGAGNGQQADNNPAGGNGAAAPNDPVSDAHDEFMDAASNHASGTGTLKQVEEAYQKLQEAKKKAGWKLSKLGEQELKKYQELKKQQALLRQQGLMNTQQSVARATLPRPQNMMHTMPRMMHY